ncbi:YciI family protein [Phenylobacterium sp. LH3H17]|uniref:YciI family protein n=1 Tax=Phenylobacterium sp. LH3H17 TaxID=2903901 RepID=UPI0020CA0C1B|nr:YciI family protein [Phenylobacterium sp. LH3H17]UTP38044.1 YciI family protein [Phenylobacterium sp. LH3H17]
MHYAILCYSSEDAIGSWTLEQERAVMGRLAVVEGRLTREGRLGPTARLLPTTSATTLRKGRRNVVLDGPYAETKEQLLGFYMVDCDGLEQAIETAVELAAANPGGGAYEIRPIDAMSLNLPRRRRLQKPL